MKDVTQYLPGDFDIEKFYTRKNRLKEGVKNQTLKFYVNNYKSDSNSKRIEFFLRATLLDTCTELVAFLDRKNKKSYNKQLIIYHLKGIYEGMYVESISPEDICKRIDELLEIIRRDGTVENIVADILTDTSGIGYTPSFLPLIQKGDTGKGLREFIDFISHGKTIVDHTNGQII